MKINFAELNLKELTHIITEELSEKKFRAGQIFKWIHKCGVFEFDKMSDIPKKLRDELSGKYELSLPEIIEKSISEDKMTEKFAYSLKDGEIIEAVKIYDDETLGKYTVCVSTQVGCPIKCAFCQTGKMGFVRNLKTSEIIGQVLKIAAESETGFENLSNVVYMGMGEPLLNYDNVIKSIRLINAEDGLNISMRKITVSTSGVIPGIAKLANEKIPVTLAISLHAPFDSLRAKLVPLNKKYNIEKVIKAAADYIKITSRRVTFEYVMLKDYNDSLEHAKKLAELLRGLICHVNLIPLNQSDIDGNFAPSLNKKIIEFRDYLTDKNINATIRRSKGLDINAACGMLYKKIKSGDSQSL